ncbi:hypothetical protein BDZ91DRAFT_63578 [Kalaharituber pfeilii]|nr:hypothetical protein BDZ91DRAFT_63578 [Kalaharituber pfeilii]
MCLFSSAFGTMHLLSNENKPIVLMDHSLLIMPAAAAKIFGAGIFSLSTVLMHTSVIPTKAMR